APRPISRMAVAFDFARRPNRAVVAGEYDQRVLAETGVIQGLQHTPNHRIGLRDEIAVIARSAFAAPFAERQPGRMRRAQRKIQEERLRFRLPLYEAYGIVGYGAERVRVFEARRNRATAPEPCPAFALRFASSDGAGRRFCNGLILDVNIR